MESIRVRRVRNLRQLIDDRFDGVISNFAREVEMHPTYVSNILATLRGTKGARPLTEKTAEAIEEKLALGDGYLSRVIETAGTSYARSGALDALLQAIESQEHGSEELRAALDSIRDEILAARAVLHLVCATLADRDPKLAPMLSRTMREATLRAGVESGSVAFRGQTDDLSQYMADLPPSLEDAARLAASLSGSGSDAGR